MACLGHGICVSVFMGRPDHVDSLKLKSKSNWNCMKTNQNMILKC